MNGLKEAVVIGHGVVGTATQLTLGIPEENCYSKQLTKNQIEDAASKKFVFLCLPTPTIGGKSDTSVIEKYVRDIAAYDHDPVFIIRSTVPVGTCADLANKYGVRIASNPEFLTESTAMKDAIDPDFTLLGADDISTMYELEQVYRELYSKFVLTTTRSAEMIKYVMNVFYATKVVFANVVYDICQEKGVDYSQVKDCLYMSKFVGKNHLDVFHKGYRGAGGKCLGKDLDSFTNQFQHPLFNLVNELNKEYLSEEVVSENP